MGVAKIECCRCQEGVRWEGVVSPARRYLMGGVGSLQWVILFGPDTGMSNGCGFSRLSSKG